MVVMVTKIIHMGLLGHFLCRMVSFRKRNFSFLSKLKVQKDRRGPPFHKLIFETNIFFEVRSKTLKLNCFVNFFVAVNIFETECQKSSRLEKKLHCLKKLNILPVTFPDLKTDKPRD